MIKKIKNKKVTYINFLILIFLLFTTSCSASIDNMQEQANLLRIRVIANSDNDYDIQEKILVKDQLIASFDENQLSYIQDVMHHQNQLITLTCNILKDSLPPELFKKIKVSIGMVQYEAKAFKQKIIASGEYPTLLIEIGLAQGSNWWSILYPEFFNVSYEDASEIEYRSYFLDLFS